VDSTVELEKRRRQYDQIQVDSIYPPVKAALDEFRIQALPTLSGCPDLRL
jgi:hypothetical protein